MRDHACRLLFLGLLLTAVAAAQGPGLVHAWADAQRGNDGTGSVGNSTAPFQTIQAAATAMQTALGSTSNHGVLHVGPGRYGYGSGLSGDRWPVLIPPRVSVLGANALSTIIDGAAVDPSSPTFTLPSPTAASEQGRPCFVFEGASGFAESLVTRLTFAAADRGVYIVGGGQTSPTVAFCAFIGCRVGVQMHTMPGSGGGQHRPKFLSCTFGACDFGALASGEDGVGAPAASAASPGFVNCLFRCTVDLEGVPADAIQTCGFTASNCNQSGWIVQPSSAPAGPVFTPSAYTVEQLFLGAATYPSAAPQTGRWFSDWRLTWRLASTGLPNPAIGSGTQSFPVTLSNGTQLPITHPAETVGSRGCAGPQDPGPLTGAPGWSLGYDTGASFHAGGTMPLTDAFGTTGSGLPFDILHLLHRDPASTRYLFGTLAANLPEFPLGSEVASGMLTSAITIPGLDGGFYLDGSVGQFLDLSDLVAGAGAGAQGGTSQWLVELGPPVLNQRVGLNLQMAHIDYRGILCLTNAEHVAIVL